MLDGQACSLCPRWPEMQHNFFHPLLWRRPFVDWLRASLISPSFGLGSTYSSSKKWAVSPTFREVACGLSSSRALALTTYALSVTSPAILCLYWTLSRRPSEARKHLSACAKVVCPLFGARSSLHRDGRNAAKVECARPRFRFTTLCCFLHPTISVFSYSFTAPKGLID